MCSAIDDELLQLKIRAYRGIAKVPLQALGFQHRLVEEKHRKFSPKHARRLGRIFAQLGCLRSQPENFINALVDEATLDASLNASSISHDAFRTNRNPEALPLLNIHAVECLSGLHRIEAARDFLDDNDQWWTVRLFFKRLGDNTLIHVYIHPTREDTQEPVLTRVIESCSHEEPPSNGEIFRKIRLYHRAKDEESENRWWACLDNSKPKDLRQLLKRRELTSAFDALIDVPGLWTKFQLGALHRLLALKCDEKEMKQYLHRVSQTWQHIIRYRDTLLSPSVTDSTTVEKLEMLAPKFSTADLEHISDTTRNHEIFPKVLDETVRETLLANISTLPCIIPSIRTFFEMLKFLEPTCEILKQLAGTKMKGTVRKSLLACFFLPEKIMLQKSERYQFELTAHISKQQAASIAYVQLWAFCCRNFDGLTTFTPRKEGGQAKPLVKGPNPVLWQHLARYAIALGFRTPRIEELAAENSQCKLAVEYLQKANPTLSNFDDHQIQDVIDASRQAQNAEITHFDLTPGHVAIERRCGRPFERDLEVDKLTLFFHILYGPDQQSSEVSLEVVRRDLFTCLFGTFKIQESIMGPAHCMENSEILASNKSQSRKRRRMHNVEDQQDEDCISEAAHLDAMQQMDSRHQDTIRQLVQDHKLQLEQHANALDDEKRRLEDSLRAEIEKNQDEVTRLRQELQTVKDQASQEIDKLGPHWSTYVFTATTVMQALPRISAILRLYQPSRWMSLHNWTAALSRPRSLLRANATSLEAIAARMSTQAILSPPTNLTIVHQRWRGSDVLNLHVSMPSYFLSMPIPHIRKKKSLQSTNLDTKQQSKTIWCRNVLE